MTINAKTKKNENANAGDQSPPMCVVPANALLMEIRYDEQMLVQAAGVMKEYNAFDLS